MSNITKYQNKLVEHNFFRFSSIFREIKITNPNDPSNETNWFADAVDV